jgi:arginine utilization protein RocB
VLDISLMLARRAMARASQRVQRDIAVMSYAELAGHVAHGELERKGKAIAEVADLDLPERAKLLTAHGWAKSGLAGPAVVIGFGSIPYPAVMLENGALEDRVTAAARPFGLSAVRYFPGISDMSFLGEASGDHGAAAANTPVWGTSFVMPEAAGFPCINIGPWGRDYHHWLERVHAPYAFEILPRVLLEVIDAVMKPR